MRKPTKKQIIEALRKTGGNVAATAAIFKYTRQAVNGWIMNDPDLQDVKKETEESLIDMAEGQLFKAVQHGDMTAIIFALKTKGKSRGYVEKQEIQIDKESVINVGYVKESTGE